MGSEDSDYFSLKLLDMDSDDGFFGLPLEPLADFSVEGALVASDMDSLLEQFEEQTFQEMFQQHELEFFSDFSELGSNSENLSLLNCNTTSVKSEKTAGHKKVVNSSLKVTNSPVSKSTSSKSLLNGKNVSLKRKKRCGISLLAKPTNKVKSVAVERRTKRSTSPVPHFDHYFYQDHDYCPNPSS